MTSSGERQVARALRRARVVDAVRELSPGELIEVLATDPELAREIAAWSRATGNAVLESSQLGNLLRLVVRKL